MGTYALANVASRAFAREDLKDWYLIEVDYALGRALEQGVRGAGGKVLGVSRRPLGTSDFSSYLLQGQGSRASVIALLNGGADAVNSVKQASEFRINEKQTIASLAMLINDVKALGLKDAQGLRVTESFYWDLDDKTRAWSARYSAKINGTMPSMIQAGTHSAVRHYLRAVQEAGTKDTDGVIMAMRALPVDDPTVAAGTHLRADDGSCAILFVSRQATEEAAVPAAESACPLMKAQDRRLGDGESLCRLPEMKIRSNCEEIVDLPQLQSVLLPPRRCRLNKEPIALARMSNEI